VRTLSKQISGVLIAFSLSLLMRSEKDGTNNSCQLPTAFFSLSPNIVAIFNTSFS
jgi:hypothetical protein